jgi:hypothetical protein
MFSAPIGLRTALESCRRLAESAGPKAPTVYGTRRRSER